MKRVIFLEEIADDLLDAKEFYDRIEQGVGDYCVDSLISDAEHLGLFCGIHSKQYGLHRALGSRFPFGIYYTEEDECVRIIAILDLRKEPLWIRSELSYRGGQQNDPPNG